MGRQENNKIKEIMLDAGPSKRLFRVNSGMAWAGKIIGHEKNKIAILNPRPFWGMPEGTPDIIGWESVTITPEMVGRKIAVFTAVEIKTCGTATTPEQNNFINQLKSMGGKGEIKIYK
jgi:hypothetical protein